MKLISLSTAVALIILMLSSCSSGYTDSYSVVSNFCADYGIDGSIYSSLAKEGDAEYLDRTVVEAVFPRTDILPDDYTFFMNSRLDLVFELGVFLSPSADKRMELSEICLDRISFLASFSDGDGEVMIKNNLLIYFFSSDNEGVRASLQKVLGA